MSIAETFPYSPEAKGKPGNAPQPTGPEPDKELTLLLTLAQAVAAIRDKKDLLRVIVEYLRPHFTFDNSCITVLSEDKHRSRMYLIEVLPPHNIPPEFLALLDVWRPVADGYQNVLLARDYPMAVSMAAVAQQPGAPEYISKFLRLGVRESLTMRLSYGGEILGALMLQSSHDNAFSAEQLNLFNLVCPMISAAVSNLLAFEDIARREQENALQLSITTAFTEEATWPARMARLAALLQPALPFDLLCLWMRQDGHTPRYFGQHRIGWDEYQAMDLEALMRVLNVSLTDLAQMADIVPPPGQVVRLVGQDYVQFSTTNRMAQRYSEAFQLQSGLAYTLPTPRSPGYSITFLVGSKAPFGSTEAHQRMLQQVMLGLIPTIEKQLAFEEIILLKQQLQSENAFLAETIRTNQHADEIIGSSIALQQVFASLLQVAATDATVLLEGETGTGKELFARALHQASPRREKVMVKVNCAGLPAQLIESELFGHEKGAFTGATSQRIGKFERADGGTLFLDEIGELPLELQPKLLRALQEKEIERVGGSTTIRCDVRIVTATNRHLEREVAAGRFRADLYFRLNVFPLTLPPLRARPEDIPMLVNHFVAKFAKRFGKPVEKMSAAALREMMQYDWPGNIRELEHVIEHAMILATSPTLELASPLRRTDGSTSPVASPLPFKTWQQAEIDNILAALRYTNGQVRGEGGAAALLKIHPNTLDSRAKKLGIFRSYEAE